MSEYCQEAECYRTGELQELKFTLNGMDLYIELCEYHYDILTCDKWKFELRT